MIEPAAVADRLAAVRARITDAGGDPGRVCVLAVTKGFGPEAIAAAVAVGLGEVGENYAQELLSKVALLDVVPRVHFLGRLQRNKVRMLAPHVTCWQTVDRPELVAEIAKRAPGASVMVQLNLSGETQKGGCDPDEAAELVAGARDLGLDVEGLMGVGPAGPPELARAGFRRLVAMADDLGLPERSIGMSADLEVAVQEGTTMVRVGTALFGPRPPREQPHRPESGSGVSTK